MSSPDSPPVAPRSPSSEPSLLLPRPTWGRAGDKAIRLSDVRSHLQTHGLPLRLRHQHLRSERFSLSAVMNHLLQPEAGFYLHYLAAEPERWTQLLPEGPEHGLWAKGNTPWIPRPLELAAAHSCSQGRLKPLTSSGECDGQIRGREGGPHGESRESPINYTTKAFHWPCILLAMKGQPPRKECLPQSLTPNLWL